MTWYCEYCRKKLNHKLQGKYFVYHCKKCNICWWDELVHKNPNTFKKGARMPLL